MSFNPQYVQNTLTEACEYAAMNIAQRFALDTLSEKGSVTIEETQNMHDMALRLITEGSEDLIPEELNLPDTSATDNQVDTDVEEAGGEEDLDIAELEGIILPDAEGNQYIIQGGIIVPYNEEQDPSALGSEDPEQDAQDDLEDPEQKEFTENTVPADAAELSDKIEENTGATAGPVVEEITENSIFSSTSDFVKQLIDAKIK